MTAVNALTSAGFATVALLTAAGPAKTYAMYAAARALPLAAVTIGLVIVRSTRALAAVAVVLGLVQACDVLIGLSLHDLGRTLGPLVLAVATLATVPWLSVSRNPA